MIVFLKNIISFIFRGFFSVERFYPFIFRGIFKCNNKDNFYLDFIL